MLCARVGPAGGRQGAEDRKIVDEQHRRSRLGFAKSSTRHRHQCRIVRRRDTRISNAPPRERQRRSGVCRSNAVPSVSAKNASVLDVCGHTEAVEFDLMKPRGSTGAFSTSLQSWDAIERARRILRNQRLCPMPIPISSAFCLMAPSVLFSTFATLETVVLAFECALSSRTSSLVQGLR